MDFYSSEIFNYMSDNEIKKLLNLYHNREEELRQNDNDIIEVKNYNVIDEEENSIEGE